MLLIGLHPKIYELIWIFGIGIFTQLGQTFLTIGLKTLPVAKASTINYLQVLFGSIVGNIIIQRNIEH